MCCRGRTRTGDLTSEGTRYLLIAVTVELSALPLGELYQLSYTASEYVLSKAQAHAGAQPCLRYLVIRSWTY